MRVRRISIIPIVLIVGMLIGVMVASQSGWLPSSNAKNSHALNTSAVAPDVDADFINSMNSTFTTIADAANPSVVTIFSERVVTTQSPFASPHEDLFRDFFGDDFFDRFFSPRGPDGQRRLRGMGSGVIVDQKGYILTNHHVIREADEIEVMLYGGKRVDAEVVGTDAKTDIAVIKIDEEGLQPLKIGDSDELKVGEWVLAIGSPLSESLARTVTSGIVSATGRSNVGLADYEDFIQTDAAINPGNSGGALINLRGELVGVNTAIATQSGGFQGIGFAVPINMASKVMDALITEGKVVRGWLGVYIQNIDQNLAKAMDLPSTEGVLVSTVTEDGPAGKAGLKSGDVILALDGEKMSDVTQLRNEVASRKPGSTVDLTILRDDNEQEVEVTLGELPEEEATPEMRKSSIEQLGFSVQTLTPDLARRLGYDTNEKGVVITQISQASAAFAAGLRQGDIIKEVNKKPVSTADEFRNLTQDLEAGETILINAKRGQNTFFAAFELG